MCTIQVFITILMCLTAIGGLFKHPECRSTTNCRRSIAVMADNKFVYYVNGANGIKGQQVTVKYDEEKSYVMCCNCNSDKIGLAADDPALPAMTNLTTVKKIEFEGCIVPNISYASVLANLNIAFSSPNDGVLHLTKLPAEPQLEGYHLKGLLIKKLLITAATVRPTRPKSDFLEHLPKLKNLKLQKHVEIEQEAITHLPESLVELSLGITQLTLDDGSRNSSFWLTRLNNSLKSLTLQGVESPTGLVITLPQLALLPKLTKVELYNVPLAPLSDSTTWLKGSKLQSLTLDNCTLSELPDGLFEGADIAEIILSNNKLETLNEAFNPLKSSLRVLDLSDNNLKGDELVNAVVNLNKLENLIVNNNRLNSLCGSEEHTRTSLSSHLPETLRHLKLKNTSATSICNDWIESDSLVDLNLDDNNIKNLWYNDLEMRRLKNETVTLSLKNNPLRIRNITQDHYNNCINDSMSKNRGGYVRVQVALTMDLSVCDCNVYWLREMLHHNNCLLMKADNVTCPATSGTTSLFNVHTQNLTCPYRPLLDGCSFDKRPKDNAIVVRCSGPLPRAPRWPQEYPLALYVKPGMLNRVPRLKLIELHAPNNNITNLDGRDLTDTLRVLDVRNNSIAHITLDAAQRLLRLSTNEGYNVSLAGNPLACGCEDETAIATLQRAKIWDWNTTQCADHQYIMGKTKLCQDMMLWPWLGVMVAVLIIMPLASILICLRSRIRQWFFDHNCCLRFWFSFKNDADDPLKTRDVFVSYSIHDLEYAKKLIEKLEAHGLSTIEHCRDWLPGKTISQQITDSVLSARRTLLLVSDNYANSQWGLAEFNAAHAHAMERGSACVIVIRCNLVAPDKLPKDLQLYLSNNTYLDWSDRYFWKKLLQVMPAPRAPQQAPVESLSHDKMVQDPTTFQIVPSGTAPVGSQVSLDKELPLSELVLDVPVQQHKRGSQQSSGQASPVTPVVREPPQPGEIKSALPLDTQRQSLGTLRMPALM